MENKGAAPTSLKRDAEGHIVAIQSLRGLAALLVLGGHALGYFATPKWFDRLHELSNGQAAVITFFVLSGYVLVRSLERSSFSFREVVIFYMQRFFRIYPALWCASLLGLLYLSCMHYNIAVPGTSEWFQHRFRADRMAPLYIIASFAGLLAFILPQIWTIFVELAGSLFVPIVAFIVARRRGYFIYLLLLAAVISITVGVQTYYGALLYLVDFVLGASLCLWSPRISERLQSFGIFRHYMFYLLVVILIGIPFCTHSSNNPWLQLATALTAVALIGLIVHGKTDIAVLHHKSITWLGDISYSLYLLHFPIMCILVKAAILIDPLVVSDLGPIACSLLLFVATLCVTLPLSDFSYRFVEKSGIAVARSLRARLQISLIKRDEPGRVT
jgi:peptidoglycan/LPS O-acetylase OafA/YrhL